MTDINHLRAVASKLVQSSSDADLLDLIIKLFLCKSD